MSYFKWSGDHWQEGPQQDDEPATPKPFSIEHRVADEILLAILRVFGQVEDLHEFEAVPSSITTLQTTSLVCRRWRDASHTLLRQHVRLLCHSDILKFASIVAGNNRLALGVKHLHVSFRWNSLSEDEEEWWRETYATTFHALLIVVQACKNIASLSTDAIVGMLEFEWALSIAKLQKLRHLAVDFSVFEGTKVGTKLLSLLGRSMTRRLVIRNLDGVSHRAASLTDDFREPPLPGEDQNITSCQPYENRAIVLQECASLSASILDVVFTHLTQAHDGRLGSVHFGYGAVATRILGPHPRASVGIINFLMKFGSSVKEITVHTSLLCGGGLSGLASACPNLERLEVDGRDFDDEDEDVFPQSLKVMTIRGCDGGATVIPVVPSIVDGHLRRTVRMYRPTYCHQTCLDDLREYFTEQGFQAEYSPEPNSEQEFQVEYSPEQNTGPIDIDIVIGIGTGWQLRGWQSAEIPWPYSSALEVRVIGINNPNGRVENSRRSQP